MISGSGKARSFILCAVAWQGGPGGPGPPSGGRHFVDIQLDFERSLKFLTLLY